MQTLETTLREHLKFVSELTREGSSKMSKQLRTAVAHDIEKLFANLKYEAVKISGALKLSFPESTLCAQPEIANCATMLSSRLTSVREATSANPVASMLSTSAAAAGTAPPKLAGPCFKEVPR